MRTIVKVLTVGAAAVTLAGCGTAPGLVAEGPIGALPVKTEWTSCAAEVPDPQAAAGPDSLTLPRLSDDFTPHTVIICATQIERRTDGGQDLIASEDRTDDIARLVAALRLPDEPLTDGACTMDLPGVPWFALLDETGRWIRPGTPHDSCGKIRIEVRDAIAGLTLNRVSARSLQEIESAAAAAAGCSQQWTDMIAVETTQNSRVRAATGSTPFPATKQVRLCVYDVPAGEEGSGKPAGEFRHGGILTSERQALLNTSLRTAKPAAKCSKPASRFALLQLADGNGGEVYVELDGCQRIMTTPATGGPRLSQGDAALTALLNQR